jgi:diglucosylglycerate octanoyltransferase
VTSQPLVVLVLGDSLTYHGPSEAHLPDDVRLWPQVMAATMQSSTGRAVRVDLFAREGWTARDAWWALTKDPSLWGRAVPAADAMVIATGGMDHLPAAIPTYLREGIRYIPRSKVRHAVRRLYAAVAPPVMRLTGGRMRQLPGPATTHYHRRVIQGVRHFRPQLPIVMLGPAPFDSPYYPVNGHHDTAVRAAATLAAQENCEFIDVDDLVWPSLRDGSANPDGMHWSWATHAAIGRTVAERLVG